jgi:hypothetical protein
MIKDVPIDTVSVVVNTAWWGYCYYASICIH